jgi:hypothetical protein
MATADRALLGCLLLLGCPAEQLGVPVPPRGLEAIDQEDLQRDVFAMLGRTEGHPRHPEAAQRVARRLAQMDLDPLPTVDGGACGVLPGRAEDALMFLSTPAARGAQAAALRDAALISLAKSTHRMGRPEHTLVFCSIPHERAPDFIASPPLPWTEVEDAVVISWLGGSELELQQIELHGRTARQATTGDPRLSLHQDGAERIDYVRAAEQIGTLHRALLATEFTPR